MKQYDANAWKEEPTKCDLCGKFLIRLCVWELVTRPFISKIFSTIDLGLLKRKFSVAEFFLLETLMLTNGEMTWYQHLV